MSDQPDPELLGEIRRLSAEGVPDEVLAPAALRALTRRADGTFPTLAERAAPDREPQALVGDFLDGLGDSVTLAEAVTMGGPGGAANTPGPGQTCKEVRHA